MEQRWSASVVVRLLVEVGGSRSVRGFSEWSARVHSLSRAKGDAEGGRNERFSLVLSGEG